MKAFIPVSINIQVLVVNYYSRALKIQHLVLRYDYSGQQWYFAVAVIQKYAS